MSITTITLSPAIDVHCHLSELIPETEHLATISSRDIGGKGVNISRVLTASGVSNTAIVVLGDQNGREFSEELSRIGITHRDFLVKGRIRENITLHTADGKETRISFSNPVEISDTLWAQIENELVASATENSIITLTGRVPEGVSVKAIKNTLLRLKALGAKTVVDSKSFSLNDLIECKPWLIKPNEEEIEQYIHKKVTAFNEASTIAEELHAKGIDNVLISLGNTGAILACHNGCFTATPPSVSVKSTVGAGDSAIAGFLIGQEQAATPSGCLLLAVAYGTASCTVDGTAAPSAEAVAEIINQIKMNV